MKITLVLIVIALSAQVSFAQDISNSQMEEILKTGSWSEDEVMDDESGDRMLQAYINDQESEYDNYVNYEDALTQGSDTPGSLEE